MQINKTVVIAMALVAAISGVTRVLFYADDAKPLTVKPVKEKKITINVVCIEGYEYIQNTISGSTMSGMIYTQRFINTDNGLRAKICRSKEERNADADGK